MKSLRVVVIGGGAAGFFGAVTCAQNNHDAEITLLEKSPKFLSKVKISGGGRCNVTNECQDIKKLSKAYPRGSKELKQLFKIFSTTDTISWFEKRGAKLKAESDGRMFPITDDSQTIVDCLIKEARVIGVKLLSEFGVKSIEKRNIDKTEFLITLRAGETLVADKILVATGGNPNVDSYNWLRDLGHTIIPPAPSLFTFNVPNSRLGGLQGIAISEAKIRVQGIDLEEKGPLLITHWGFSGPAILRLSAWGARLLQEKEYNFTIHINWIPPFKEETLREEFIKFKEENPKKVISNHALFGLPRRLWERFTSLSEIDSELRWMDISKRNMNKLIEELINGTYTIKGKTTFKEEFVTCGGIPLNEVNLETLESNKQPGIYFAGEVLDIDGITGGFNFQAAWTTGYIAGKAMAGQ